jgi:hypothetical protein
MTSSSKQNPFQKTKEQNPTLTNIGKSWSKEEEKDLLYRISKGETIKQISTEFKRTNGGIRSRLKYIACNMVLSGKSMEEATQMTTINNTSIKKAMLKYNYKGDNESYKNTSSQPEEQQNSDLKELITLTREIHTMLKELVTQNKPAPPVIKKIINPITKSSCLISDD